MPATYAHPSTVPAYSRGPEVAALTSRLGRELLPWQADALAVMLETPPDDPRRLVRREATLIVPRRNGKTDVLIWHALTWCILMSDPRDPAVYLYTAHEALTAATTFRTVVRWLHSHPELAATVAQVMRGKGSEEIVFRNGARFAVRTRTGSGGRGLECHALIFDEALELTDEAHAVLLPLVGRALRQGVGQVVYTSSAGHGGSTVLTSLRDSGRTLTDPNRAYLEYTAPRDMDPYAEETWQLANPSYGSAFHGAENVAAGLSLSLEDFGREYLGWWTDQKSVPFLPHGAWDLTGRDTPPEPEAARPRVALGIEWQDYGRAAALVAVVATAPGEAWTETVARWDDPDGLNPDTLAADIATHARRTRARIVAGDAYTTAPILEHLTARRIPTAALTGAQMTAASRTLLLAVTSGRLTHPPDPVLSAELTNAGQKPAGDGMTRLSRATSTGLSLSAFAVAAAAHHVIGPTPAAPAIIAAAG